MVNLVKSWVGSARRYWVIQMTWILLAALVEKAERASNEQIATLITAYKEIMQKTNNAEE